MSSFSPKSPNEVVTLTFDFSAVLDNLISATVAVSVFSGTDANPSAILLGSVTLNGADALQTIQAGLEDVTYQFNVLGFDALGNSFEKVDTILVSSIEDGTPFDALFTYIVPEVVSAPNSLVRNAILRAAIEFCERSQAYYKTYPISFINSVSNYEIPLPYQQRVVIIREILLNTNRRLTAKTIEELSRIMPDFKTAQGSPTYYLQPNPHQIAVYPQPNYANTPEIMSVRATYAPTVDADTLPNELINLYAEAISAKAKSILLMMPKKTWSDAQLGAMYRNDFMVYCDTARIQAMHERTQGSLSVKSRSFGA